MNTINEQLSSYIGTGAYHKSFIPGVMYTDGARAFANFADAFWVLDDIAAVIKLEPQVKKEEFVVAQVRSNGKSANIDYEDGNYNIVFSQRYEFTSLPAGQYSFFVSGGVIYLPSEH